MPSAVVGAKDVLGLNTVDTGLTWELLFQKAESSASVVRSVDHASSVMDSVAPRRTERATFRPALMVALHRSHTHGHAQTAAAEPAP